jgi:hypothetical protein
MPALITKTYYNSKDLICLVPGGWGTSAWVAVLEGLKIGEGISVGFVGLKPNANPEAKTRLRSAALIPKGKDECVVPPCQS